MAARPSTALRRPPSPSPRASGSSSSPSTSPASASRAHSWFQSIRTVWQQRDEGDPTNHQRINHTLHQTCDMIWFGRSTIHPGVMFAHADAMIEIVEAATRIWQHPTTTHNNANQTNNTPLATTPTDTVTSVAAPVTPAAPASSSDASSSSVDSVPVPAVPPVAPRQPFRLAPGSFHSLLRVLVLLSQRLPNFYSQAWAASLPPSTTTSTTSTKKVIPIPIPKGMEYTNYQHWFERVRKVSRTIIRETLERSRHKVIQPFTARLSILGTHLLVLALCHAPGLNENPTNLIVGSPTTNHNDLQDLDFIQSCLIASDRWFANQLPQYEHSNDLLTSLGTTLINTAGLERMISMTRSIHASYMGDNDHTSVVGVSSPPHGGSKFVVDFVPPGVTQHETLLKFMKQMITGALEMRKIRLEMTIGTLSSAATTSNETDGSDAHLNAIEQIDEMIIGLLHDSNRTFRRSIDSIRQTPLPPPSSPRHVHRSMLPMFALIGLLDSLDPIPSSNDPSNHTNDERRSSSNNEKDGDDDADGSIGVMREEVYRSIREMITVTLDIPDIRNIVRPESLTPTTTTTGHSSCPWPCNTHPPGAACGSCLFVLVVSAGLVHATRWIVPKVTSASSPASSQSNDVNDDASRMVVRDSCTLVGRVFMHLLDVSWVWHGTIVASPPNEPMASSTNPTSTSPSLAAWLSSPLYALIPHFTRSFGILFLAIKDINFERHILKHVWEKLRYAYQIMRWAEQNQIKSVDSKSPIADSRTAASASSSPPSSSSSSPSPLSLVPSRVNRASLKRAHQSLFMSVTMFLYTILQDQRWRGTCGLPNHDETTFTAEQQVDPDSPSSSPSSSPTEPRRLFLSPALRLHAYQLALIFDMVTMLEPFGGSTLTLGFQPSKTLSEILQAILEGREVRQQPATTPTTLSPQHQQQQQEQQPVHHARAYRRMFAREILIIYTRCFFTRDASSIDRFLGLGIADIDHLLPAPRSIPFPLLLGISSRPLSSKLVESIRAPDWATSTWAKPVTRLEFETTNNADDASTTNDRVEQAREMCMAGLLANTITLLPLELVWHTILPWAARCSSLESISNPNSNDVASRLNGQSGNGSAAATSVGVTLARRAQHILVLCIQRLYRHATCGLIEGEDGGVELESITERISTLPTSLPTSSSELEHFCRQLIPFLVIRSLRSYPKGTFHFESLLDTTFNIFITLPTNDMLLVNLLHHIIRKIQTLMDALLRDEKRLKRWRRVTDVTTTSGTVRGGVEQFDILSSSDDEEMEDGHRQRRDGVDGKKTVSNDDVDEDSDLNILPLPPNVRLPNKFPSMTSIRRLFLLYLQLMQVLDSRLYPCALQQLEQLFVWLDPNLHPIATPIRSSLATMIYTCLTRGFDLTKRDLSIEWFIRMVERLRIPIGIKAEYLTPRTMSMPGGASSPSSIHTATLRNLDAIKAARERIAAAAANSNQNQQR